MPEHFTEQNRHVREFAIANRLRFTTLPDGEVVLPLGPRKRSAAKLGNLGTQAWYAGDGRWCVFFAGERTGDIVKTLRSKGYAVRDLDGEIEIHLHESDLLDTLDAIGNRFRPWRKRLVSDEQRRAMSERFAAMRSA